MDEIDGNFDDFDHDEVEEDSDCYHYHAPVDDYIVQVMIMMRMARMMVLRRMVQL